jgi:hypothetical protein
MTTIRSFTVRNASGQYLGTFNRYTANQAIQAFIDSQRAYFSTFRTRQVLNFTGLTARVETELSKGITP